MSNKNEKAYPQFEVVSGERDGHGDAVEAYTVATGGLTKRELIAAMAMQGILSQENSGDFTPKGAASEAIEYADALLEALK